ncbi:MULTISPECIES: Hsp20/alpha crystallin family protein [unclassified Paenibacillus]|uniref:Hsp20/alpha crystallin family protein n=1 Tax=unclassified Paenibacillus TaxID=185978 RepID=UPI001C124F3E|nr:MULTISPECIES: Hsp20/alpha crystallin family protein [unclassified Paenibacillus]MBU5441740.1 Hsp20/alpha crystallin family protein [Paenibacillus sp. MSJ-34]CAH0122131.1 hypothetical protein PAE9249_04673 [Paenibacillus sp. CECT 9249]
MGKLVRRSGRDELTDFLHLNREMTGALQQFMRRFDSFIRELQRFSPRLHVEENEKAYLLELRLPGIDPKDIVIERDERMLTFRNNQSNRIERKNAGAYAMSYSQQSYHHTFPLPPDADPGKLAKRSVDGALQLYIPKRK